MSLKKRLHIASTAATLHANQTQRLQEAHRIEQDLERLKGQVEHTRESLHQVLQWAATWAVSLPPEALEELQRISAVAAQSGVTK